MKRGFEVHRRGTKIKLGELHGTGEGKEDRDEKGQLGMKKKG